jgi:hypothetical protein
MRTVHLLDAGIYRSLGKPPNQDFSTLRDILLKADRSEIKIPRPIYAELGGNPDAESQPSGSPYVDDAIREGWATVGPPVPDSSPVSDAVEDARFVMQQKLTHPQTAVVEADLSLIGVAVDLFERAETIHVNLFTTDLPLHETATAVVQYYGYYDLDAYFAAPQNVVSDLLVPQHVTAGYKEF